MAVIMNKLARSESILQSITEKIGVTPSGHDFLIANLDPMHDAQLQNLVGWPDVENTASIVRCIKQTLNITCPYTSLTGTWDAHIITSPVLTSYTASSATLQGNAVTAQASPSRPVMGGIQVYAQTSGNDLDLFSNPVSALRVGGLTLDKTYSKGVGRLIGAGLEVVNTTSDLNRQGTLTVYRQSQTHEADYTAWLEPGIAALDQAVPATLSAIRAPPVSIAEAMLYPGTRTWKAADGAYVVFPFVGQDNPPSLATFVQPTVLNADYPGQNLADPAFSRLELVPTNWVDAPWQTINTKRENIHMPGMIFTGLSQETTLTLQWNLYYESFPNRDEPEILVLAKPSCVYDPVALEILSRVLSVLPVGVPASWNADGSWFSDVVGWIKEYAPKIGDMIGAVIPGASLIGRGVGSLAEYYDSNYLTPPAMKNSPKMLPALPPRKKRTKPKPLPPIPPPKPQSMRRAKLPPRPPVRR